MLRFLRQSEFGRHVLILVGGAGVAQLLLIAASPLFTRLYTPANFGVYALFMAVVSVMAIFATGRYETAIFIAEDNEKAFHVVTFCLFLAATVSAILFVVALCFRHALARSLHQPDMSTWLLIAPPMVFTTATYQVLNCWFNRNKQYRLLAANRVVRSVATVCLMIAFGVLGMGAGGIVIATVVGLACPTTVLMYRWNQERRREQWSPSRTAIIETASRYRDFGIYSIWGGTLNAATGQLPTFVLTAYFGPLVVGLYNLTQRVLAGPASMLATAIGNVFQQRAADDLRNLGNCRRTWWATFGSLMALSIPIYALIAIFAPAAFALIFGEPWRAAGTYARVLCPFFLLSFSASVLSRMTQIAEKQKQDMLWQIALFVLVTASLFYGAIAGRPVLALALFSASYCAMYLIYLSMSYRYSAGDGGPPTELETPHTKLAA
jgi:O-antigen/teichoic acid export membrane protein